MHERAESVAPEVGEDAFLTVDNLSVRFPTHDGLVQAVSELSYSVSPGKTLGIVGESGSGKSVSSMAVLGLHDPKHTRLEGSITVGGVEIIGASESRMRAIRGKEVAMIFQDALTSLHPFFSIGDQIAEGYRLHHKASKSVAKKRAVEMLDRVGIPQANRRVDDYPHQFSGGMRQRAMIAMALVNDPKLLIADEPTTALDVTVQAQILDLLQDLQKEFNSAIIMITHDLGVVAEMADEVMVMYGGRAVEYGKTGLILTKPEMPYSWGLMSSVPDVNASADLPLIPIPGNPPSLLSPPKGCAFHPRCAYKDKVPGNLCATELPPLVQGETGRGHLKRCHLANAAEIYLAEVLPEVAPDLIDPETGELLVELDDQGQVVHAPTDHAHTEKDPAS
ncbi:MAG: ABC transporter ATP-binding protein [Nocardioides sp.]